VPAAAVGDVHVDDCRGRGAEQHRVGIVTASCALTSSQVVTSWGERETTGTYCTVTASPSAVEVTSR
jgi:hypothetical protein